MESSTQRETKFVHYTYNHSARFDQDPYYGRGGPLVHFSVNIQRKEKEKIRWDDKLSFLGAIWWRVYLYNLQ